MNLDALYSELTLKMNAKVVLVVLDGLGDIATREQNFLTPLEAATTPNLDVLAKESAQGRMIPVAPGITPGSGPGHLGLFGYDPLEFQVGRGVIEAQRFDRGCDIGHGLRGFGHDPGVDGVGHTGGIEARHRDATIHLAEA